MSKDTGGPAFPESKQDFEPSITGGGYVLRSQNGGMTLRDWFAGQALAAIIQGDGAQFFNEFKLHAELAYLQADAMLAERSKP